MPGAFEDYPGGQGGGGEGIRRRVCVDHALEVTLQTTGGRAEGDRADLGQKRITWAACGVNGVSVDAGNQSGGSCNGPGERPWWFPCCIYFPQDHKTQTPRRCPPRVTPHGHRRLQPHRATSLHCRPSTLVQNLIRASNFLIPRCVNARLRSGSSE